ncbi:MAG TPA: FAD-dependent oxidoreductase [Azonexus sp.]|nr:FAD-dependent oxidoreductase [Azonexus sp.]
MRIYDTRLEDHRAIAEGTMAFDLAKPPGFIFKPGQAIDVVLINPPGPETDSTRHTFSIVSAPFEDRLTVATRMRDSAFKRTLKALAIGAPILFEGPSGSLTLHNNRSRPAVMIAGGIGITPFVSILRQAAHDQLPQQLLLLYSNHRPEDAAFLDELQGLEEQNKRFRLLATMTQMSKSSQSWAGRRGPIDEALVHQVCDELVAPIFYLAGPPALVDSMRQTLNQAGIDDDDIRSEEFYGY